MTTALIGHTGFVGETLKRQARFDALFRSTDIGGIEGRRFDLVVCAGAPAAKWKANREPEADRANLAKLMAHLAKVAARRFLLVSTVDVYPSPVEVDEATAVVPDPANAYGANRFALEQFCRDRFEATVVRLPALFGQGLRKNAIFDLIHENAVEALQPRSSFQFYDMERLWADLLRVLEARIELLNLATEPLVLGEVARRVFGRELRPNSLVPIARYDFRTRYGALFGRRDGYAYGAEETLERLASFAAAERGRIAP